MTPEPTTTRWPRLKTVLVILATIVSLPFLLMYMLANLSGDRR